MVVLCVWYSQRGGGLVFLLGSSKFFGQLADGPATAADIGRTSRPKVLLSSCTTRRIESHCRHFVAPRAKYETRRAHLTIFRNMTILREFSFTDYDIFCAQIYFEANVLSFGMLQTRKKSFIEVDIKVGVLKCRKLTNVANFSSLQQWQTGDSHSTLTLDGGQCGVSEASSIAESVILRDIYRYFIYRVLAWPNCQATSDFQISNSSEKLRSFWIQIFKAFFSKSLFRGRAFDLNFCITTKEMLIQV